MIVSCSAGLVTMSHTRWRIFSLTSDSRNRPQGPGITGRNLQAVSDACSRFNTAS